jgi:hypothetical protein
MSIIDLREEFRPAYKKLMAVKGNARAEDLPITAERYYDGWTEQERFVLILLILSANTKKGHDFFENIPANTILKWFKTLRDIGGRRRSEGAWPWVAKLSLEKMVIFGGSRYLDFLTGEDLPYECMTAATIAVMVLYAPHTYKFIKNKLASHLPLEISDSDEKGLDNFFPGTVYPVPTLEAASELFDRRGKEIFFKAILLSIMRTDISSMLETAAYMPVLWISVSQPHITLFAENLREDSYAAAFCRLCMGRKLMSLSEDGSLIAEFFSSRPDKSLFKATLSLFLMTWPGVSTEFVLRLFECSLDEHERIDEWDALPKIISKIQNPNDRKDVARGVSLILRRRYRKNMNRDVGLAVRILGALGKQGAPPAGDD